jgi:hypothetical protein
LGRLNEKQEIRWEKCRLRRVNAKQEEKDLPEEQ